MLKRHILPYLQKYARQYPIVTITGPRQSGKSTLVKASFPEYRYISLEDPDHRMHALEDPRDFLSNYPAQIILDEVQRVPNLFSYLQTHVDHYSTPGQYILTGSEQFELGKNISQTLAGRTAILRLLPLSCAELLDRPPQQCWFGHKLTPSDPPTFNKYQALLNGGYPRIQQYQLDPFQFHRDYLETYITRDLRKMLDIGNLAQFELFMRLLAGRSAQQLNYSSLSNEVGVADNTIKRWLSVLQQSYIVATTPPYFRNTNKRLVKAPKVYFLDTGLLCYLLNIRTEDQVKTHPLIGAIFETFIYTELVKAFYHQSEKPNLHYWSIQNGPEIDIVLELGPEHFINAEIKLASTLTEKFFKHFAAWETFANPRQQTNFLIYGGETWLKRKGIEVIPWFAVS